MRFRKENWGKNITLKVHPHIKATSDMLSNESSS